MPLFKRKKKVENEVTSLSSIKLFDDEKDVGFYENTKAADELTRQKSSRVENNNYVGLFDDELLEEDTKPKKSVAKTYGTKYISDGKQQIASSKVVDVRSYKKEEDKKPEEPKIGNFLEESAPSKPKRSFFDDLLKELDDEEKKKEKEEEKEEEPIVLEEPKKVLPIKKAAPKKAAVKKKKSIDIDIISGDFGGADIL